MINVTATILFFILCSHPWFVRLLAQRCTLYPGPQRRPTRSYAIIGGLGTITMAVQSEDPGSISEESQSREDTAMIQNDVLLGRSNLIQLLPTKSIEALLN